MGFISISEVRKRYKHKGANFIRGYFDGYNNPTRSKEEINNLLSSGRYDSLSDKTKDYVEGKSLGVEDRMKSIQGGN